MILVRAPLHVSLFGGGTGMPVYYKQYGPGRVLSATIDKYVYVAVQKRWDGLICAHGIERELVPTVDEVRHELIREALRMTGVNHGVEVTTMADVPGTGTGLGSSSSLTVALLLALYEHCGLTDDLDLLAHEACEIEIGILGKPIGKQDQYAACYGGLCLYTFGVDGCVSTTHAAIPRESGTALDTRLMLFYTGQGRQASDILASQRAAVPDNLPALRQMAQQAQDGLRALQQGELDLVGAMLHEAWLLKQSLCNAISNETIDDMYARARAAGALGGKVTGAGGGGFLLLYVPPERQEAVRAALSDWREMPFGFSAGGAEVLVNTESEVPYNG